MPRSTANSAICSKTAFGYIAPVGFDGLLTINRRVSASMAAEMRSMSRTNREPCLARGANRGSPPHIRLDGDLMALPVEAVQPADSERVASRVGTARCAAPCRAQ